MNVPRFLCGMMLIACAKVFATFSVVYPRLLRGIMCVLICFAYTKSL